MTAEGFPPEAAVLTYDKAQDVFKSGHHILQELVGDIAAEVQFTHDAEWEVFPEVAKAIKKAGGEENCLVVATCPAHAKWGVGMGGGWKTRESAAKVALALSIGKDVPGSLEKLAGEYPEFADLCVSQGLITGMPKRRKTAPVMPMSMEAAGMGPFGGQVMGKGMPKGMGKGMMGMMGMMGKAMGKGKSAGGCQGNAQEGPPFWMQIGPEDPMPMTIDDLPREALALSSNGNGRKGLYNVIDQVLANFGLDVNGGIDIEFVDDPDGDVFPEIGRALKPTPAGEQPLHVAICRALGVYGCGLSSKWKNRNSAAKVALALLLVVRASEGGDKPDLSDYPAFAKVMEEVPPAPFAA